MPRVAGAPATRTRSSRRPPSRATRCATTSRSACAATGLTVHEDYGTASHRIDIAVEDPYHRGRALIAVETDGERYAALRSTRDRDRLRPEQLARLGWVHERVWSTDVFRDPAREIARIVTLARSSPPPAVPETPEAPETPESGGPSQPTGGERSPDGPTATDGDSGTQTGAPSSTDGGGADEAPAAPAPKRKRRRVFRKGTGAADTTPETDASEPGAALGRSSDELDLGWGERPSGSGLGDRWLEEQRPPHYE